MRSDHRRGLRGLASGAAFLGLVLTGPASAAELDICYLSEPPEDAIESGYDAGQTPFSVIGQTLNSLFIPRALCGFDVDRDRRFWRSYVVTNGCSPKSDVASLVEEWLVEAPPALQPDFDTARAKSPDRVAKLCTKFADCVVPEFYDPSGSGFYCPSLSE